MSQGPSSEGENTYLLQPREPDVLAQVRELIGADASIKVLQEIGPAGEPHTLVVAMREQQAAELKHRFAGRLIVERDRPLTLYSADSVARYSS